MAGMLATSDLSLYPVLKLALDRTLLRPLVATLLLSTT